MTAKKKSPKKPVKKSASKKSSSKKPALTKTLTRKLGGALPRTGTQVIYVDSCFFFPPDSSWGYIENFQEGRNTVTPGRSLMAALPLPVNATIKTITIYYKNITKEDMQVVILKKHIDHHCFSGEVEVSIDFLPPAALAPDNFVAKLIDHFDAGGLIKDKYLYFIEISNTTKTSSEEVRTVRGMRIEYAL